MNKKLEIRDLRILFRTTGGMVQAVRNISFDLYEGETLAIVGESGSGKSVTSRAIMGISAVNAVIESGEILYNGRDLLKFTEAEYQSIRGNKIAMIFQDPMSSLNPIVRIGRQLTEAMILKNRVDRVHCRRAFDRKLKALESCIDGVAQDDPSLSKRFGEQIAKFRKFEAVHIRLESEYNLSREAAEKAAGELEQLLIAIEKKPEKSVLRNVQRIVKWCEKTVHPYLMTAGGAFSALTEELKVEPYGQTQWDKLQALKTELDDGLARERPNFFAMGYWLACVGKPLPEGDIGALNQALAHTLENEFMDEFSALLGDAVKYSFDKHNEYKKVTLGLLKDALPRFAEGLDKKSAAELVKKLCAAAEQSIDRLEVRRDSNEYTFRSSLHSAYEQYYAAIVKNAKEQKRYDRQSERRARIEAKGKTVDWKVVPPALVDPESVKGRIAAILTRLIESIEARLSSVDEFDAAKQAKELIAFFQENASGSVYRVTGGMAKNRAIKLMEEVGIPEPEKRFYQYPFQMSGGQRQRIVIAIALAANPDILICDEPTTALDVTIQSQILELINRVKRERKLSVIFITHDLGVVANMADRIAVMYAGKIVEYGTVEDVFYSPAHPYTWALLSSVPDLESKKKLEAIPGTPPNMIFPPKGDAFAERNKYALDIDYREEPPMFEISETHGAATWLLHPLAPKVSMPTAVSERIERMKKLEEAANE